ncbi:MAG: TauD/TfdA family dioxygenase [Chromatiales bacterium]|jgi:alpha-ketoglutarate-dependent taurine dioxygenase|nr:TauD/TfdA family dioxygenase [Chromatiales bacterium]
MVSLATQENVSASMIDHEVVGPRAWRSSTIEESDWRSSIPDECIGELDAALERLRAEVMPMLALDPADYDLPACGRMMAAARERLEAGSGVAVLDRLPVERYSHGEVRKVFWLLGSLLGRPVSQSVQGEMIVSVRDTGIPKRIGVRGFRTNCPQHPHTDNSFNHCPPDHVSLLSLHKAAQGGVSKFISFFTVHNEMRRLHPQLLPRLYQLFYQDRQGDFRPGEPQTVNYPVFSNDGEFRSRYTSFTIPAGYQTAGVTFDGDAKEAFDAVTEIIENPELYCSFIIEPGQLQIVNNRTVGHGRGEYVDLPDLTKRRHLLRLWHRDWGRRGYGG